MSDLEDRIASKPAPKVTRAQLDALIRCKTFYHHGLLTMCVLDLQNGFTVLGQSACADERNFDAQIGEELAYLDAYSKLWPLEGYLLRQRLHEQGEA